MVSKVVEGSGNYGYNAATGEYEDMVAMGGYGHGHVVSAA